LSSSSLGGAQLVSRYQGLSADHIEYLTPEGVAAMSRSGTVAVLLPGAFYFLNETRKPPVELLRNIRFRWRWRRITTPAPAPLPACIWR
jgi:imidazolonepropionase-like amidohydrolase